MSSKSVKMSVSSLSEGSSSIVSRLKNIAASTSWTTIGIIVFVILLITVTVIIYNQQIKPGYRPNSEHIEGASNNKNAEIMLFSTDWCPHCKTAKPEWEQVKTEYQGKKINGYTILFTEVNCTNESPDVEKMMNTYKIEGYPTIKLLKDGQIIEYDAKPTKDTIIQFLNTVV